MPERVGPLWVGALGRRVEESACCRRPPPSMQSTQSMLIYGGIALTTLLAIGRLLLR